MKGGHAELLMYPAPPPVRAASERWLTRTLQLLGSKRLAWPGTELNTLFRSPDLLLTQTCGYPLITQLSGRVRLVGRPDFDLAGSQHGEHCSLILVRDDDSRGSLQDLRGCRGGANSLDSNTGMNLLRHTLAPWQQNGRFFKSLALSGSHRRSLQWLREGRVDLIAIDSVTFAYLALYAPDEVAGVRTLHASAPSPTLPYITAGDEQQAQRIRAALNQALSDEPHAAHVLRICLVLPAREADYHVLLDYQRQACEQGLPTLQP